MSVADKITELEGVLKKLQFKRKVIKPVWRIYVKGNPDFTESNGRYCRIEIRFEKKTNVYTLSFTCIRKKDGTIVRVREPISINTKDSLKIEKGITKVIKEVGKL